VLYLYKENNSLEVSFPPFLTSKYIRTRGDRSFCPLFFELKIQ
jgi:hypothetical protein